MNEIQDKNDDTAITINLEKENQILIRTICQLVLKRNELIIKSKQKGKSHRLAEIEERIIDLSTQLAFDLQKNMK